MTVTSSVSGSADEEPLCFLHNGILNQEFTLIRCGTPLAGRYVRIQKVGDDTDPINIYEVEVHGVNLENK